MDNSDVPDVDVLAESIVRLYAKGRLRYVILNSGIEGSSTPSKSELEGTISRAVGSTLLPALERRSVNTLTQTIQEKMAEDRIVMANILDSIKETNALLRANRGLWRTEVCPRSSEGPPSYVTTTTRMSDVFQNKTLVSASTSSPT